MGSIPTVAIFWKFIFFKLNYYILISINYYNNNIILNFSFGLFFLISISCSKHDLFEKISSEQNFITGINKLYIEIKAYFLDKLARTKSEILLLLEFLHSLHLVYLTFIIKNWIERKRKIPINTVLYIILVDARIKNLEVKIVYDFLIKQFIFNKNIFSF